MGENLKVVWSEFAFVILPNISKYTQGEREREREQTCTVKPAMII
jgi:hypothetical protein